MEILERTESFYLILCHRNKYVIDRKSPPLYTGIDDASQNKPFPANFDDHDEAYQVQYEIGRYLYLEYIKK